MGTYTALFGVIVEVIFNSPKTDFCRFKLATDHMKTIVCEMYGFTPLVGMQVFIEGTTEPSEAYGSVLAATWYIKTDVDVDIKTVNKILCSIPGIGPATATLLIETFGKDAYNIIFNSPDRLQEVSKLSQIKRQKIVDYIQIVNIIIQLCNSIPLSKDIIAKLYIVGREQLYVISKNPYSIVYFADVPFKILDACIQQGTWEVNSINRLNAYTFCVFKWIAQHNTVVISKALFLKKARQAKSVSNDPVVTSADLLPCIQSLLQEGYLAEENDKIGIARYINSTHRIAECITKKTKNAKVITEENILSYIQTWLDNKKKWTNTDIKLSNDQIASIYSLNNMFSIITGGPGTGKSFIIDVLTHIIETHLKQYAMVVAPTGKAAIRLTNKGVKATTIHRGLGYKNYTPNKNHGNPILCDYLIIDESSMVDYILMGDVLEAITDTTKVILVGDKDQLPPVEVGRPFADIIKAKCVPVYTLTDNFRQRNAGADIVEASKAIVNSDFRKLLQLNKKTSFHINTYENNNNMVNSIYNLFRRAQNQGSDKLKSFIEQALFLVATNSMKDTINNFVLEEIYHNKSEYFSGMKVINTENDYAKDVFNGEIGYIQEIANNKISVLYEKSPEKVIYSVTEASFFLEPAYAITVHKSQGSEAKIVYVIMDEWSVQIHLWNKSMLYTAVTRGKVKVHIIKSRVTDKNGREINPLIQGFKKPTDEYSLLFNLLTKEEQSANTNPKRRAAKCTALN